MTYFADRIQGYGTSAFTEFTQLAIQHKAINLGQGFPNWQPPDFALEAAHEALAQSPNQYAPCAGVPPLRNAIAQKVKHQYGLTYNPDTELTVSAGASESIQAAIAGLVNPGDEVIVFQPYFDTYVPNIRFAHGMPIFYTLDPPHWTIDPEKLAALFTPKTKLLILNSPHNPTGKVFSRSELETVADLCIKHDVIAMSDEVYEHIIYDDAEHIPLASLPGMRDRTIMISSFGKTFSATGWKIGWALGSAEIISAIIKVRQFTTFCGAAPLQLAAAVALDVAAQVDYYSELRRRYQQKRDFMVTALVKAGLKPLVPEGAFYIMVDLADSGFKSDDAFCRHLTEKVGVAAIPSQTFYQGQSINFARFAYCKTDERLQEAAKRLVENRQLLHK